MAGIRKLRNECKIPVKKFPIIKGKTCAKIIIFVNDVIRVICEGVKPGAKKIDISLVKITIGITKIPNIRIPALITEEAIA